MRIEWDEKKNRANKDKHGLSFELAQEVFDDPLALSRLDRVEDREERWQTLGMVEGVVLLVAHTVSEESDESVIRIISARKATRREQKRYEKDEI